MYRKSRCTHRRRARVWCIYMYKYTYLCVNICIHTMHIYRDTPSNVYLYIYTRTYIHLYQVVMYPKKQVFSPWRQDRLWCMYVCTYICVYIHSVYYICIYAIIRMYTNKSTNMRTHICTYIHTHLYTRTYNKWWCVVTSGCSNWR